MPVRTVYLDDDHNQVPEDRATYAVETETDQAGEFVSERWIRIVRDGSDDEDWLQVVRDSERRAAEARRRRRQQPVLVLACLLGLLALLAWWWLR